MKNTCYFKNRVVNYTAIYFVILLIAIVGLTGCTSDNPAHVYDDGGIDVNIISGANTSNVTVVNTPLPVDISQSDVYYASIAEGDITGHDPFFKLGYNNAVATTEEDIWYASAPYVFPAAGQRMIVYSSSVSDNATGTGVQKVIIYYLDDTYAEHTEIVTLNGATAVQTVATNIYRINYFRAYTTGTGYKAAGHIDLKNLADTISYSYIAAGYTTSRDIFYTVPLGKSLYITDIYAGVGGLNAASMCRITPRYTYNALSNIVLTPGLFFMPLGAEMVCPNGTTIRHFDIPLRIPETVDVKVSALVDAGSAYVEVNFQGWIEDD